MVAFLEEVAKKIIDAHGLDLEKVYVVLPNRRAGLFLKKHLAKQIQKPFFPPKVISIEDFVVELTGIKIEDPVYLLFNLFQIHKNLGGDRLLKFGEFAQFGEMLLHDFSDIDFNLADAKSVFTWLSEEKAISLWSVDGEELTPSQKSYLRFYSLLYTYYEQLSIFCAKRNRSYHGSVFRIAAENIHNLIDRLDTSKIWMVGFNALTKSEHKILRFLERSGKAEIVWDADKYYMESEVQEAGYFLRKYKGEFKNLIEFSDCFAQPKIIDILGTSGNVLQAKYVGQEIQKLISSENANIDEVLQNTAIVLADENLLIPVLNSLPQNLPHVNVTMGYPFRLTSIYDLVNRLLQMHASSAKGAKRSFKRDAILLFLGHAYWQKVFSIENLRPVLLENLSKYNKSYLSIPEIEDVCTQSGINFESISILFTSAANAKGMFQLFDFLIELFGTVVETDHFEKEYLYTFYNLNNHLKEIQEMYSFFNSLESLQIVYTTLANKISIAFYGEPLRGLQIMGLLETRVVDFKNVIILSVNEGVIPTGKTVNTLLPFQIKKHFEIPSYTESDSIFAYHFYRLLQRSEHVKILYNTDSEGFGKSEKSRFIKQIELELKNNSSIEINNYLLTATENPEISKNYISAKKDNVILDRLKVMAEKGFSATALNTYIRCPLQFYYSQLRKIEEALEIEETIDNAVLGTVIHFVMENIFAPTNFASGYVTSAELEKLKAQSNNLLIEAFNKEYPQGNLQTGKNKLIFEIAQKIIYSFIKDQQKLVENKKLEILGLETELRSKIVIQGNQEVRFYGKADRIDRLDNVIRVVDYKSGNVLNTDLRVLSFDLNNYNLDRIPEKSFQLLLYSWLYKKENKFLKEPIYSGIYSFRRIDDGLLVAKIDGNENLSEENIAQFEGFLTKLLEDIFDTQQPFEQTKGIKKCAFCAYTSICGR